MTAPRSHDSRTARRTETRNRIRLAARSVMRRESFAAATIRAIAAEAGVAAGSVVAHFGSKEDLLFSIFHEDIAALVEAAFARAESGGTLDARLRLLGESMLRGYAADPGVSADFLRHALLVGGAWGERFRHQVHESAMRIAGWYTTAAADGEIRPEIDLEAAVLIFLSAYYFLLLDLVRTGFSELDAALRNWTRILDLHLEGIRRETHPPRPQPRGSAHSR